MPNRFHRRSVRLVSTAVLAAVLVHRGAEAREINVCIDQSNPAAKMDQRIAQALAPQMGVTERITYFDGRGDDADDGLAERKFSQMAANGCNLIMGFPVDSESAWLPDGVKATAPYATTGFVLLTHKAGESSIDALPKGTMVGVTYLTAPNLFLQGHSNVAPEIYNTDKQTLSAVQSGKVGAAMIWRPYAASQKSAASLHMADLNEPHARWNLVALYDDKSADVAASFETAAAELNKSGKMDKLAAPFAEAVTTQTASAAPASGFIKVAAKKKAAAPAGEPALYTADQATKGKAAYAAKCAICHGDNLEGKAGPALTGASFASPTADFSVGDVFFIVANNMPATAPGTLSHDDYTDIMAYILQQNNYPAGSTALTYDGATNSEVKLLYKDKK